MPRLALLLALVVSGGGCVSLPIGQTTYTMPHVVGTLHLGGAPVEGAEVWQTTTADEHACAAARDSAVVTTTSASGGFDLPAVSHHSKWRRVLLGAVDYAWGTAVCFSIAGVPSDVRWENFGGPVPALRRMECEVDTGAVRCGVDDEH